MHECTLAIHQVKLVVDTREDFGNGRGVADHANSAHHLRKITARHHSGRLVVDAALESGGAPIDKLNSTLRLDGRNSCVDVLGHYITAVHEATCHILAMAR